MPDGHCWLWNIKANAFVEIFADGKIEASSPVEVKAIAPIITLDGDVNITGDLTVNGVLN